MNKKLLLIFPVILSGCVSPTPNSTKVFSNAQIQYQAVEPNALVRKKDMEMPSYFLDVEYEPKQIALNQAQKKRIDSIFKKLIYPEEYKLYVSFGAGQGKKIAELTTVLKRAQYIRKNYSGKLKNIQIAYIKQQKPNSAYFRLIS